MRIVAETVRGNNNNKTSNRYCTVSVLKLKCAVFNQIVIARIKDDIRSLPSIKTA